MSVLADGADCPMTTCAEDEISHADRVLWNDGDLIRGSEKILLAQVTNVDI